MPNVADWGSNGSADFGIGPVGSFSTLMLLVGSFDL